MSVDSQQSAGGAVIGGALAAIKSFMALNVLGFITTQVIFDTVLLSVIGASVGWAVTELWRAAKRKWFPRMFDRIVFKYRQLRK